jgi:poly(A) polymerase
MALMEAMAQCGTMRREISELTGKLQELQKTDFAPPPLLTGDDLAAAGWTPGPIFKRVLDAVYDAQLEDQITTKEHAIKLAVDLARHQ